MKEIKMTTTGSLPMDAAKSNEELMNVLLAVAATLKTQVIASPVLAIPDNEQLRNKLSALADEVHGLQADVVVHSPKIVG